MISRSRRPEHGLFGKSNNRRWLDTGGGCSKGFQMEASSHAGIKPSSNFHVKKILRMSNFYFFTIRFFSLECGEL